MLRFFAMMAVTAAFLVSAVGVSPAEAGKLRVALVLTGPINDGGWNESGYRGLKRAETELGLETAYSENVLQPDIETVMSDYASKGYDLVIGSGFEFFGPAKAVALEFPKVWFAVVNGRGFQEPNLCTFGFRTEQSGFLAGALSAMVSKSGKVGYIGGMNAPHIQTAAENFLAGAKYARPDVDAQRTYVGSWTDVAKAKEMAYSMLDRGADVLVGNANAGVLGIIEAAKARDKWVVGYIEDQHPIAPETIPVSVIQSVERLTFFIIEKAVNKQLKAEYNRPGIAEGVVGISPYYGDTFTPEMKAKVQDIIAKLNDGTFEKQGLLWEMKK